ncbi:MAG: SLBB domain-containing protein [Deltaproteobacteria bacterium]|nr:SLBB domain-containing protein [Deltaproteobacteria bacterium]
MKKSILLLIVILGLILPANPAFSQNVNPSDAKKYLDAHPELQKYDIYGNTSVPEKADAVAMDKESLKELKGAEEKKKEGEYYIKEPRRADILPVFGKQFFSGDPTSFTPPSNIPVSTDYIVGPDDNIVVQLWGRINEQYDLNVKRDGSIQIPKIGVIQVAGLTYKQLQDLIKREAEAITGVNVSVSMGKLRSITIFVVGSVKTPGTYTVSAFDTLLNALIYAGGPEIMPPQEPYEDQSFSADSRYASSASDKEGPTLSGYKKLATRLKKEKGLKEKYQLYDKLDTSQLEKEIKALERVEERQQEVFRLKKVLTEKESAKELERLGSMRVQELETEIGKIEMDKIPERQLFSERSYAFTGRGEEKETHRSVLLGSMRNVQLKRHGKTITTFDLYDLILKGDNSKDVRLEPGDIVFVPKADAVVAIEGDVKAPAVYELKKDKSLLNALNLAGGIKSSAYSEQIQIQRYLENRERVVLDMSMDELKREKRSFTLQDGDVVKIFPIVNEDTNAVYLFGNVMRSGKYGYFSGIRVSDVIKIDDLKPETYFPYALIKRYNPPERMPILVPFDLGRALLKDNQEDVLLQSRDEIQVFNKWAFEDKPDIKMSGEVRNAGTYRYDKGMRVKDAIFRAGGLTPDISMGPVNIFRTDPKTKEVSMIVINLAKAMTGQENANIVLQDKDRVIVHSIREYAPEKKVSVKGAVTNPGEYPLSSDMTIRDLVFAAGNLTESAYIYSAELTRYSTSDGKLFKTEVCKLDLKKALEGGVTDNVKLRNFDELFIAAIPKWQTKTKVLITGEVALPGEYSFTEKGTLSELIERAGDYLPTKYLRGAVLTRESAKVRQKSTLDKLMFEMEKDLASSAAAAQSGALSKDDVASAQAAMAARQTLLNKLKGAEVTGRVIVRLVSLDKLKGSKYDFVLEDGDALYIPKKEGVVHVMGSVYNPTSLLHEKGNTVKEYLSMVGGPTVNANPDDMCVIRADGTIVSNRSGGSNSFRWDEGDSRWFSGGFDSTVVYPGDTILVPRKLIEISGLKMAKDITSVLYQIAVSVGVINTLF